MKKIFFCFLLLLLFLIGGAAFFFYYSKSTVVPNKFPDLIQPSQGPVYAVIAKQNGNSAVVLAQGKDQTEFSLGIYNRETSEQKSLVNQGITGSIPAVELSADEKKIIVVYDNNATVWNAESGKIIRTLSTDEKLFLIKGFKDFMAIITPYQNSKFVVMDAETSTIKTSLPIDSNLGQILAVSPDSKYLLGLLKDTPSAAGLWDMQSGKFITRLEGPSSAIQQAVFSANSELIAAALSQGGNIAWVWNTQGALLHKIAIDGESRSIPASFSGDGKLLALGGKEGILVSITSGAKLAGIQEENAPITSLCFTKDNQQIITGHENGMVEWWFVSDLIKSATAN